MEKSPLLHNEATMVREILLRIEFLLLPQDEVGAEIALLVGLRLAADQGNPRAAIPPPGFRDEPPRVRFGPGCERTGVDNDDIGVLEGPRRESR